MDHKKKQTVPVKVTGFQVLENECIWMKAGVVNFRLCDNAYHCMTCAFDKGMQKAMGGKPENPEGPRSSQWASRMRQRSPKGTRPCRHVLTGRIEAPKICPNNYECHHCEYDQWLDEYDMAEGAGENRFRFAAGFRMADDYYYHHGHTWVSFEHGGLIRIGFDEFLVKLFGPMNNVTIKPLGSLLKPNQEVIRFTRNCRTASVLSPVSGTMLAANPILTQHPDIPHMDPYRKGWVCIIEPEMPKKDGKKLMTGSDSITWMETEAQKLMDMLGADYEKLAAQGGEPVNDIYGACPELDWTTLTRTFLGAKP